VSVGVHSEMPFVVSRRESRESRMGIGVCILPHLY
jgi:hypothetical protein